MKIEKIMSSESRPCRGRRIEKKKEADRRKGERVRGKGKVGG